MMTITIPSYYLLILNLLILLGLYANYRINQERDKLYQQQQQMVKDYLNTLESFTATLDKLLSHGEITLKFKETSSEDK